MIECSAQRQCTRESYSPLYIDAKIAQKSPHICLRKSPKMILDRIFLIDNSRRFLIGLYSQTADSVEF